MMTKPIGCQDTPFHRMVELHFPIGSLFELMALIAISGRSIPVFFRLFGNDSDHHPSLYLHSERQDPYTSYTGGETIRFNL